MKLSEFRNISNNNTAKASEITRQLSLAGIAIVWLFKNPEKDSHLIDYILIYPLIFLSLALIFDLIQYVIGGYIWMTFFRQEEKKLTIDELDPEIKAPENKRNIIYLFYYAKIISMLIAYTFIFIFLFKKI